MSDRFHSLTVVLEKDMRDDDAKSLIQAIKQLRGVINVTGNVANIESHMAEERARHELSKQILDILYPKQQI